MDDNQIMDLNENSNQNETPNSSETSIVVLNQNQETGPNEKENIVNQEKMKEKKKIVFPSFSDTIKKLKGLIPIKKKEEEIEINVGEGAVSSDTFEKTELSETDKAAQEAAKNELDEKEAKKKKLIRRVIIIAGGIILFIIIIVMISKLRKKQDNMKDLMKNVTAAKVMTISSELSGSGTLSPKDSYTITSLVEGNVISADFEVGDEVKEDQLLIVIDSGSAYRSITNASSSLAQAKDNYDKAKLDYEKMLEDFKDNIYHSQVSGTIKALNIKAGDIISGNTEIGTITNDSRMTIKVPFLAEEASYIREGMEATMVLSDTDELIKGYVVSVDRSPQSYKTGAQVKYVKVECRNPGGLTINHTAQVYAGGFFSMADANFEVYQEEKITLGSGNDIEVEYLIAGEGQYVSKGDPLFKITDKTIINATSNIKNSYLSADSSLQRAESSLEDAYDAFDEYNIKAPIDGTVITKDVKTGDKIQKGTSGTKTLAVIYDLSELSFTMDVDELDISKVKVGQPVEIEADAFTGKRFKGEITKVSLVAANSNGVTNYPVTITIKETGELLPGMNVDSYVTLQKSENCVGIPAGALQRGNVVYVLNDSPTIKEKKYNQENISDRIKNATPDGFTAVSVETGVSNENFIEIKSGIQDGDQVYVSESPTSGFGFGFGGMGGGMRGGMGGPPGGMRR